MNRQSVTLFLLILLFGTSPLLSQNYNKSSLARKKLNIPGLTLNINPVGAALYGPIVQAEIKLTNPIALVPWIRYSYAGMVSTYQWTNFENDSEYSPSSVAVGLGLKKFISAKPRKNNVYYGGAVEFIHEKGLHNTYDPRYEYEQIRYAAAAYGNVGYRWKFKRSFYLNLGILPGVAFDIKNKGYYSQGASEGLEYDDYSTISFIGQIDCSFGWDLQR